MKDLNMIKAKYIVKLVATNKYVVSDLSDMSLIELRQLVDKEFPIVIHTTSVTASGHVVRRSSVVVHTERKAA